MSVHDSILPLSKFSMYFVGFFLVSHTGVHMRSPGKNWAVVATWKCCNQ
jgi:hypothetical protein